MALDLGRVRIGVAIDDELGSISLADAKTTLKALTMNITAPDGLRQRAAAVLAGLGGA